MCICVCTCMCTYVHMFWVTLADTILCFSFLNKGLNFYKSAILTFQMKSYLECQSVKQIKGLLLDKVGLGSLAPHLSTFSLCWAVAFHRNTKVFRTTRKPWNSMMNFLSLQFVLVKIELCIHLFSWKWRLDFHTIIFIHVNRWYYESNI